MTASDYDYNKPIYVELFKIIDDNNVVIKTTKSLEDAYNFCKHNDIATNIHYINAVRSGTGYFESDIYSKNLGWNDYANEHFKDFIKRVENMNNATKSNWKEIRKELPPIDKPITIHKTFEKNGYYVVKIINYSNDMEHLTITNLDGFNRQDVRKSEIDYWCLFHTLDEKCEVENESKQEVEESFNGNFNNRWMNNSLTSNQQMFSSSTAIIEPNVKFVECFPNDLSGISREIDRW